MNKIITNSEKETFEFAKNIARTLTGGETLCLIGDLGSGKTSFVKGLAAGLGIDKIITSPTFVLMKNYDVETGHAPSLRKLVHIDAYRLSKGADLEAIGVREYLNNPSVIIVIEWADRVRDIWPKNFIEINFKTLAGDEREIIIHKT